VEGLDDGAEVSARLGQAIPHLAAARLAVGGDDSGLFQLAQALAEREGAYRDLAVGTQSSDVASGTEVQAYRRQ
jgi:hypothetical protein